MGFFDFLFSIDLSPHEDIGSISLWMFLHNEKLVASGLCLRIFHNGNDDFCCSIFPLEEGERLLQLTMPLMDSLKIKRHLIELP